MKTKWEAAIPRPTGAVETLCRFLEFPEPKCQSVAIRAILRPPRQLDHLTGDPFQPEFEKWAIMQVEQPFRDMDAVIWVEADQVRIEGGMVDFGQRQAVRDDGLS